MVRPDDTSDEQLEIELPPLDDDDDEVEPGEHELSDLVRDEGAEAEGLDDAVAGDLDVGGDLDVDDGQEALGDEGEESSAVDVGALDEGLVGADDRIVGDDEAGGLTDDDDDFGRLDGNDDDGGTEGTGEPIEDEVDDGALPELDADEEGDHAGDGHEEAALGLSAATGAPPPWDAVRWQVREGAGAGAPCAAVAADGGRVLAVGDVTLSVDEGAHAARRAGFSVPGAAVAVALADGVAALATARGAVFTCEADTATPLPGWRASAGRVRLAATPGRVWILCGGTLWCSPVGAPSAAMRERRRGADGWPTVRLDRPRESTNVLALAASGAVVVAVTSGAAGVMVERMRSDDEGWICSELPADAAPRGAEIELTAAAAGRAVALANGEAVHVSRDGGATFRKIERPGVRAVAFVGNREDSDLAALVAADVCEVAYVVRIPPDGEVRRLAEIDLASGEAEDSFGEVAIAWDTSRELLWVACRKGLLALGPAPKH